MCFSKTDGGYSTRCAQGTSRLSWHELILINVAVLPEKGRLEIKKGGAHLVGPAFRAESNHDNDVGDDHGVSQLQRHVSTLQEEAVDAEPKPIGE